MSYVVVENPANEPMKIGNYNAGVISTPGMHYTPVLFSDYECTRQFHQMERDVYEHKKKNNGFGRDLKTPKSLYVILGLPLVLLGGAGVCKFFTKIFRR